MKHGAVLYKLDPLNGPSDAYDTSMMLDSKVGSHKGRLNPTLQGPKKTTAIILSKEHNTYAPHGVTSSIDSQLLKDTTHQINATYDEGVGPNSSIYGLISEDLKMVSTPMLHLKED